MRILAASAIVTVLTAVPVSGADFHGSCCADLEERIAELEASTARKGNRKVSVELSGHVHESLLWWNDGDDSATVSPFASERRNLYQGTSDVSPSRFRVKGEAKIGSGWKASYLIEIGTRANRLSRTDETTDEGPIGVDVRHSTWWLEHERAGRIWLGLTSQATDDITEVTTANTRHFARFSFSRWNSSNHIIVDGVRSADRRWRDLLPADGIVGDNVPGEGDRRNEVRYDSPKWQGFQLSAAWGEDDFWDVAVRYASDDVHGFRLAAGIGLAHYTDDNIDPADTAGIPDGSSIRGCASGDPQVAAANDPGVAGGSDQDCDTLGGSLSIMHVASGVFLSLGAGIKDDKLRREVFSNRAPSGILGIDDEDWFWGVQSGLERKFNDLGKTTLYGEYMKLAAGAQIGDTRGDIRTFDSAFPSLGPGNNFSRGSEVWFWGIGINQNIEKAAMDVYLAYRHYEGEITLSDTTNTGAVQTFAIEDMDQIMTGAIIRF